MNGPILENFQNTGDLGVKFFQAQLFFLDLKNLFESSLSKRVENGRIRTTLDHPVQIRVLKLSAGNCNWIKYLQK